MEASPRRPLRGRLGGGDAVLHQRVEFLVPVLRARQQEPARTPDLLLVAAFGHPGPERAVLERHPRGGKRAGWQLGEPQEGSQGPGRLDAYRRGLTLPRHDHRHLQSWSQQIQLGGHEAASLPATAPSSTTLALVPHQRHETSSMSSASTSTSSTSSSPPTL